MNQIADRLKDARYIAVERKIRNTFFELLAKEGFRAVSVRMIVENAQINRSTFYLHYKDKYDLLETVESELSEGITALAASAMPYGFQVNNIVSLWEKIAAYLWENRAWFDVLSRPDVDPDFLFRIAEEMQILMYSGRVQTVEEEYRQAALLGMVLQIVRTWFRRGFQETPEEYLTVVKRVLKEISLVLTNI